jgi:predicted PurR-regulated permease PerM
MVLYAAYLVRGILVLVLVAAFLAIGLDPAMRRLEQSGLSRGQAVLAIFLAAVVFLIVFALAVIPPLVSQIASFARTCRNMYSRRTTPVFKNGSWRTTSQRIQDAVSNVPATISGSLGGLLLGAVPAVIVAFFTSLGPGVATLLYFLIYQQVENYLIAPPVMTRAVDISPAAVLLAALIGGSLLGFSVPSWPFRPPRP